MIPLGVSGRFQGFVDVPRPIKKSLTEGNTMRQNLSTRIFLLVSFVLAGALAANAQQKKLMTADQVFRNAEPRVLESLPSVVRWLDDTHYLVMKRVEGQPRLSMVSVDVKTGKEAEYKGFGQYESIAGEGWNLASPASTNDANTRAVYVKDNDLYYLDTEAKQFKRLTESKDEEKNPTLSPDGKFVAFTRNNDLYAIDAAAGKEFRYTSDGADAVYSGWAAWVYFEEILGRASRYRAFWWSPDSRKIAFYRFDENKVPVFPIYSSEGQHGFLENQRYPKSGDTNPEVRVGVVAIDDGKTTWADFNEKDDQYFGTPFWTRDSKQLWVQWMNRGQDNLRIYAVDLQTGKKTQVYSESQPSWVDWLEEINFLKGNNGYVIKSDKDGWMHIYYYDMKGNLKTQVTKGKWGVSGISYVDEDDDLVYFTARKETSTRTDLYKVGLNGKGMTRLTFGPSSHSARLSTKGSYFVTTYSNVATPSMMGLYNNKGKLVRELGNSKGKEFDNYDIAKVELFTIRTPDGYDLPAVWTLPVNFDSNKKYPVLISIYGGPSAGTVYDTWRGTGGQWLAQEGMIQMSVDHRASGHFGKEGVALMHRNLGKWEMNDYIEAVKWLRTKQFVDATKICITGGSYGGYTTAMALTFGADYFTHGIASSSVTDWQLYDTHYTERFMDTPAENPDGYKAGSVMTYVDKYKGMLRIVHGTMDDNVHMQNSIQLVDKLEELGKHFELMVSPGGRHGWGGGKAVHSRSEGMRFYYKYLLEKPYPEDLFATPPGARRGRR